MTRLIAFALALACSVLVSAPHASGQFYEKVFDFAAARLPGMGNKGASPYAPLVQGPDGTFYGTTSAGGENGNGTVFMMTPAGALTTLVDFTGTTGANKGTVPGDLILGNDGYFYGTTGLGGTNGNGTVFKMTAAGKLTTLAEFTGTSGPGPLIQGSDGNFYGTTSGQYVDFEFQIPGAIFRITPAGALTILQTFSATAPPTGLVEGSDGNFYGTTDRGGANNLGTIFKMTRAGTLTTLVDFTGNGVTNKGTTPNATLVQGSDGNFYGTTAGGGAADAGTVFKMTPAGALTTLVQFTGSAGANRGSGPGGLVQGSDGVFYGMAGNGDLSGLGTIFFKVTPAGAMTPLAEFPDQPGATSLMLSSNGAFYGTTANGGASSYGTIFKITPAGALTTLVEFTYGLSSNVGFTPGELSQGTDSNFYGVTNGGGADDRGTIFSITPTGAFATLVQFTGGGTSNQGAYPFAGMTQGSDGNFYGVTSDRRSQFDYSSVGTIFKMTPAGMLTTLIKFTDVSGANKGREPSAALLKASDGNFYGTTRFGGASDRGTVFKMTPAGVLTTLVEFTGAGVSNRGAQPNSKLVQGSDGNFYGTTEYGGAGNFGTGFGTIFKMTSAGALTTLVEFTGIATPRKGSGPSGLVQGSDGNFYGTTIRGGTGTGTDLGMGTIFKMTAAGALTTLVEFSGNGATNKGDGPYGGLVQANDGNFYGTTFQGGASDHGTIFKVTSTGTLTTLREFLGGSDGDGPGRLITAADGNLYGTTSGYITGPGTIYRLILPGAPTVVPGSFALQGTSSALVEAQVNARGSLTAAWLDLATAAGYAANGNTFVPANAIPLAMGLSGYQVKLVGTTITNLAAGTSYVYRLRAVNSSGTALSTLKSFSTLAEPVASTLPASEIAATSARFNGTVNARNFDAEVGFEWGTDGNTFPNTASATPGTVTGNTPVDISAAVAGLVKGQTYFYRVVAKSSGGTVTSGTQSFITLTDPVVTVGGATVFDASSASVTGTVDARGASAAATFEYANNPGFTASLSVPAVPSPVTGVGATAVSATLSALTPGTTYYFRVRATSAGGAGTSSAGTFATPKLPAVTATAANGIGASGATLMGSANAQGLSTTVEFEYGTDGVNFPARLSATPSTATGTTATAVSANVGGLVAGTTYHFRVRGTSSAGAVTSNAVSFMTLVAPTATTGVASVVTGTSGMVSGMVNARGSSTVVIFEYGTDGVSFPFSVAAAPSPVAGSADTSVSATLGGLGQGTKYYFRTRGTSVAGAAVGDVANFTTLQLPQVAAGPASGVSVAGATLSGTVNARGSNTTVSFEVSADAVFTAPNTLAAAPAVVSGSTATPVSASLGSLPASTTFYYRVRAVSAAGTVVSDPVSFTTPNPPTASVAAATNVTGTSAQVNGLVDAAGASAVVSFEIATDAAFTSPSTLAAVPSSVSGAGNAAVSAQASGLTPGATYHYRVKAVSAGGAVTSNAGTFTTVLLPVLTVSAPASVGVAGATLQGTANANGPTTTVIFEYGTDGISFPNSVSAVPATVTGTTATSVSAAIGGLDAETTYHVRVRGTSVAGTAVSSAVVQFATLAAPVATTGVASVVTGTSGMVSGMVNARGSSTAVIFEYGTDGVSFPFSVAAAPSPVAGSADTSVSATLGGLGQGTKYYFRTRGTSVAGAAVGDVANFTTLQLPQVSVGPASGVSVAGATLSGTVNARGSNTTVSFEVSADAVFTAPNTLAAAPAVVSGSTATPVSASLGSLPASTIFYYRVRAVSAAGTVVSDPVSFATPNPPTASVAVATNVTGTSAQVNGLVDAAGASAAVSFEIATEVAFTSPSTLAAVPSPVSGAGNAAVSAQASGLTPGATYHYRVKAVSAGGTVTSDASTFTTPLLPVVTVSAPASVGVAGATLQGTANANGPSTTVVFEYGTDGISFPNSVSAVPGTMTGTTVAPVSAAIGGLDAETTYHVRVRGTSVAGTAVSSGVVQFKTLAAPMAATGVASAVTATTATVSGTINARGSSTAVIFEYGTDGVSFPFSVAATPSPVADSADTTVSAVLGGLAQGTKYYFHVRGTSVAGAAVGDVASFITLQLPQVTVGPASGVSVAGATLSGAVNARGTDTAVSFEVSADAGFTAPNTLAASPAVVSGSSATPVSASLSSLPASSTFYYRVRAVSAAGTVVSDPVSFTTPNPPTASVAVATNVTGTSARVNGLVDAAGASAVVSFEIATDMAFTNPSTLAAVPSPVSGAGNVAVSAQALGLAPGTTYHYRIKAVSAGGTITSDVGMFATPALPVVNLLPATNLGSQTATLNAEVNAKGPATATVTFEYGPAPTSLSFIVTATPGTVTGNGNTPVSASVGGLQPLTTYYFRVRATSVAGEVLTSAQNFATTASARAVTGAGSATLEAAKLSGTFNAFGQPTTVGFDYGTDAAHLDQSTPAGSGALTGTSDTVLSATVTGLTPGTRYYFRARAGNADGTTLAQNTETFDVPGNETPVAVPDIVFYAGQVLVDPLENDEDPNNLPPAPKNAGLQLDPVLVVPPNASLGVASVTSDRRFISYNPQFNVRDDDSLTYRVLDSLGASAQAQVRLIAFSKRAGLYGGKIVSGSGATAREGQVAVQMGGGGAISTSFVNWPNATERLGESFVLKGVFDQRGRFSRTLNSPSGAVLTLNLQLDADLPQMHGIFEERVNGISTTGQIAFTLTLNAGTGGLAGSGLRTGFLSPPTELASVMANGFVRMTVGKDAKRGARFAGRLPDGEPFLASAKAQGRTYELTRKLEQGGLFTGLVRALDGTTGAAGMMGDLYWQKRASSRAKFYRGGVETMLSLSGAAYPQVLKGGLPPIGLGASIPNARLHLGGGDLPGTYRDLLFNILPGGAVQIFGSDPLQTGADIPLNKLQIKVDAPKAAFTGRFLHPATGKAVTFEGAFRVPFDEEPGQGRGVFRGPSMAGAVQIEVNP